MSHDHFLLVFSLVIVFLVAYGQRLDIETLTDTQQDRNQLFCKCMEYWQCFSSGGQLYSYCAFSNEVCCLTNSSLNLEAFLQPEKKKKKKAAVCGKKEFDSGIEEYAEPGEWGWHTAILIASQDLYICGGTLIDEKLVLTAAHCVDDYKKPDLLKVRIGEYDVRAENEPEKHEEFSVGQIFIHPNFNNNTLVNDIALIKLKQTVKKKPNINIVCLPESDIFTEERLLKSKCFITGYGRVSERGDHSYILKEVNVPLWNRTKCEQSLKFHFGPNYQLPKTAICAGDESRDAWYAFITSTNFHTRFFCSDGDGGGGLYCQHNQLWYHVGIISFGIGCGRKNSPGVYTNVKSYLDWIHKITSQD